ncbi:MAG: hypothetical protein K2P93_03555 [Alphaproteobacteria bacterium]|nr:hypothetical protein [Alphaproteobacteria bacterium]
MKITYHLFSSALLGKLVFLFSLALPSQGQAQSICGDGKPYFPGSNILCCDGKVTYDTNAQACCSGQIIDASKYFCQNGQQTEIRLIGAYCHYSSGSNTFPPSAWCEASFWLTYNNRKTIHLMNNKSKGDCEKYLAIYTKKLNPQQIYISQTSNCARHTKGVLSPCERNCLNYSGEASAQYGVALCMAECYL